MTFRSESYRRAVAALPCIKCSIVGYSQCAHANSYAFGKGARLKASDAATFPLCCTRPGEPGCHVRHDQYIDVKKDTLLDVESFYIAKTVIALIENGTLKVVK
jgi:hypothetical protein